MADESRERRGSVLQSAGRGALTVLRKTRQRTKLSQLHLPIGLHPHRQQTILLQEDLLEPTLTGTATESARPRQPERVPDTAGAVPGADHARALRGRLASSERRVARLRYALERERQAQAQARAALARPDRLIEHLVADLAALHSPDAAALRHTVARVLAAYGFAAPDMPPAPAIQPKGSPRRAELPTVPGWPRALLEDAVARVGASQRAITSQDIFLCLEALARHRAVTPASVAREARLTSGLARHRLRLALEGLYQAGLASHDGQGFSLIAAGPSAT